MLRGLSQLRRYRIAIPSLPDSHPCPSRNLEQAPGSLASVGAEVVGARHRSGARLSHLQALVLTRHSGWVATPRAAAPHLITRTAERASHGAWAFPWFWGMKGLGACSPPAPDGPQKVMNHGRGSPGLNGRQNKTARRAPAQTPSSFIARRAHGQNGSDSPLLLTQEAFGYAAPNSVVGVATASPTAVESTLSRASRAVW